MERLELAVGIPPLGRHGFEFGDLSGVHGALSGALRGLHFILSMVIWAVSTIKERHG
jgi:hypothetical protein